MEKGLDSLFSPRSIALMGATENPGSVGRTVMTNLLASFKGKIYPVNPKRPEVLGIKAYPSIAELPERPDLVVIVTPAKSVPKLISDCADAKIPIAVVISAGFKEMGPPGIELEEQILTHARMGGMRVIGPNCLGIMRPSRGLNATFAADMALPGKIAFISQSGALCTAVLDWSLQEKVGFSAFVSIGSMLDVEWSDLIDYFGSDDETESILIYMESIGNARAFLSAAREVALTKPIILIKAGRTAESAKAAASHTGALSGSDDVLSAALNRAGVLRVDSIADLFSMADLLAKQPRPRGPHLAIVTNAGGPGVIATDALIKAGGQLSELDPATIDAYNAFLPPQWSRNNPIDILGDAKAELYVKAVEIALNDPNSDGVLVVLTPQDMTEPTETAEKIAALAKHDKPLLASWMGARSVAEGQEILLHAGIPSFEFPDMACKAFAQMWQYSYHLRSIYEVPELCSESGGGGNCSTRTADAEKIIAKALSEGRTLLDEVESKKVVEAYSIPIVPTDIANSAEEAVALAEKFGFPIVLKLFSKTITHKTDVGGVKLNLKDSESVKKAYEEIYESVKAKAGVEHFQGVTVQPMIKLKDSYELILGSTIDDEFGPVLLFGSGGQLVEVFKDSALAIPPLTSTLARRVMEKTKIYHALLGVRGRKGVDIKRLEQLLVQFSSLIVEPPWIKECDINPLLVGPDGIVALDARVLLHDPKSLPQDLPQTAIKAYPSQYIEQCKIDGHTITIRPIRPDDEPLLELFHKDLSKESVRQRWMKDLGYEERMSHERLSRISFVDYDREIVLIAEIL
jgi:acetyltransferase